MSSEKHQKTAVELSSFGDSSNVGKCWQQLNRLTWKMHVDFHRAALTLPTRCTTRNTTSGVTWMTRQSAGPSARYNIYNNLFRCSIWTKNDMFQRFDQLTRFDGDSPTNCKSVFCSRSTPAPSPLGFRLLAAGSTKPSMRAWVPSCWCDSNISPMKTAWVHMDTSRQSFLTCWSLNRYFPGIGSVCCWFVGALRRGAFERESSFIYCLSKTNAKWHSAALLKCRANSIQKWHCIS